LTRANVIVDWSSSVITPRHRKSGPALVATLAVALGCLLAGASAASANTVDCWGAVAPTATAQTELTYAFQCSEPIKGFSIVSSLEVGEFSTTADVLDLQTMQPVSGETFTCEGDIPSDGFGCFGKAYDGRMITGTFGIDSPRCVKRRNKLRTWIVALDLNGNPSGPQGLVVPPRCAKAKAVKHHKHR
jgi:hypothetical protein